MNNRFIFLAVFSAMLACMAVPAAADELHYTNLLIGDRASGMGGAYTAVSDDATGLYYNPAGIAYAAGRTSMPVLMHIMTMRKRTKASSEATGGKGDPRPSCRITSVSYSRWENLKWDFLMQSLILSWRTSQQVFTGLPLSSSIQSFNPGLTITSYTINFNNESNIYNLVSVSERQRAFYRLQFSYHQTRSCLRNAQFIDIQ